jgi:hypothetical protein
MYCQVPNPVLLCRYNTGTAYSNLGPGTDFYAQFFFGVVRRAKRLCDGLILHPRSHTVCLNKELERLYKQMRPAIKGQEWMGVLVFVTRSVVSLNGLHVRLLRIKIYNVRDIANKDTVLH